MDLAKKKMAKIISCSVSFIFLLVLNNQSLYANPTGEGIQVYQKNVHLMPEHKQKLADDINRYRNADNLWDVLRDEFSLPHYEESYAVQAKIEWYMNNQDYLLRTASRAAPYLYYISQQVRKRHLPAELVLLPIVESAYNPFSVSNMGASGLWQLMPDTATGLGIKNDWWFDGRRDVIASTSAALNYLAYLQSFFEGNWILAIAAYNTGEGNVLAAIKRNIRDGRDTDFWSLPVAQQTRDYVPSLLALATIISRPDKYPVYLPPIRNAPYLAQVDVGKQINLKYAAMLAGISNKKLLQLNPGFKGPSLSMRGPFKLILPIENVEQFTENLARSPMNQQNNWLHYKVKSGDTLATISKKFGTSIVDIRKMNDLGKNGVKPGINLLIPPVGAGGEDDDVNPPKELASASQKIKRDIIKIANKFKTQEPVAKLADIEKISGPYTLKPGDTIYVIRANDTLESIAKRFNMPHKSLLAANQLQERKLKPGKQLIIPTHPAEAPTIKLTSGDTIYTIRRGDTIEKIARKYKTTASAIRVANLIDNNSLTIGETIVIPERV